MNGVQPKVTGTFGKTPLLHVLTSLMEQATTGTLVIETSQGGRSALSVEHGTPVKMRFGQSNLFLAELLVEYGWIRREVADLSYEKSVALDVPHGKVLVVDGHIDAETLDQALRLQLVRKLLAAAGLPPDTAFGFYEGVDYLSKWRGGKTPVGPLLAIWALARVRADPAVVATVLSRIAGRPLRLHPKAHPKAFGFDRTEMTLLDVLRAKPQKMEALTQMGLVSPQILERMVYVLTLTRHLDFGRGLEPLGLGMVSEREESLLQHKETRRISRPIVMGVASPVAATPTVATPALTPPTSALSAQAVPVAPAIPAAPPVPAVVPSPPTGTLRPGSDPLVVPPRPTPFPGPLKRTGDTPVAGDSGRRSVSPLPQTAQAKLVIMPAPSLTERRTQLEKLGARIAQLDHFEVLGLPRDASVATAQDTYLRLAKAYHPDRLPPELADLKPLATRIFARMGEAHLTLSDTTKRAQYLEQLNQTPADGDEESIRKILNAAGAFQKAEVLLKKRMLAAAELEVNRALEGDPDQADYLALYAWIQACKPDSEARLPELCKMLSGAIARNPASEKNRFYRVQIYKRLGEVDKAVADCRIIVEKNPHHVDALREIRLWDMRRSAQKQNPPGATRGTNPQRGVGTRSPSDPPSVHPAAPTKDGEPPASPGGLFGRFFKR